MPRIVGVGDTVSAQTQQIDGKPQVLRGGSDRGFLTLVQDLGKAFRTDNAVLYVDSSCGEVQRPGRSEEHTSELQSLMRISYAVFCLKKKKKKNKNSIL